MDFVYQFQVIGKTTLFSCLLFLAQSCTYILDINYINWAYSLVKVVYVRIALRKPPIENLFDLDWLSWIFESVFC